MNKENKRTRDEWAPRDEERTESEKNETDRWSAGPGVAPSCHGEYAVRVTGGDLVAVRPHHHLDALNSEAERLRQLFTPNR
ncbi:hypothetical protein GWI33_016618 [Rhynchophorus ferrugineus]|uniref:Uncharacterized protein n=1 Tax=Rhynchophorus ferrugineus TaxID=354439 RepID=A0A834I0M0_RHYFE|nr:hypothetical protein GWI33_016618 [Rhynchophorus ferrugineus]